MSERTERILNHSDERAITNYNRRRDALRGVSPSGFPEDNDQSRMLTEGFQYGVNHGRAEGYEMGRAEGEKAATERLANAFRKKRDDALARGHRAGTSEHRQWWYERAKWFSEAVDFIAGGEQSGAGEAQDDA